jgi:starch phosphorylase
MTTARDGTADLERSVSELARRLPGPLAPIAEVAHNYWWSWSSGGRELFKAIDARGWELAEHNPIRLLHDVPLRTLDRVANDAAFLAKLTDVHGRLREELDASAAASPSVAFFCMEYGVHRSLPIFAGGLGVLGGDLVKEASDRRLPFVAVGLLYRQGYLHQRFDTSGWQHEHWTTVFPERLPAVLVTGDGGEPLCVEVGVRGRSVRVQIWRVDVGRTRLYLLDAEHPANHPVDRWITSRLYVTDRSLRLAQYLMLGAGGVRALHAMGIEQDIVHLNEGHAVFAGAELARGLVEHGASVDDAIDRVRTRIVFTTHTPVAAGNETFPMDDVRSAATDLGPHADDLLACGRSDNGFGLTEFGLRTSRFRNGVSRLHGEVARDMWTHLGSPAAEIAHVTNGVHIGTWMAAPMRELLERHLGTKWEEVPDDPAAWEAVDEIPDAELWTVRCEMRARLVAFARERAIADRLGRGEELAYVEQADAAFDPGVLTLGFARRAAAYKRVHLLALDPQRALGLLGDADRPMQVFLAGKAHPADEEAKTIVRSIFDVRRAPEAGGRVAWLEDYDMRIARYLVAGCDVWLNVPRPPLEASGTSGMKAALNGGLNLSVLDGWWAEGYDATNGWAIDSPLDAPPEEQDAADAAALYDLLEREVVPLFYERDESGVPRGWIAKVKASLRTIGPRFNSSRMLRDYVTSAYTDA